MSSVIENKCIKKGVRLTDQRKLIAKVMSESADHPDVDELHKRVSKFDTKISIATVYRTVKLFEEAGIVAKHDFKGNKARYEQTTHEHHDHLIDIDTGEIVEFVNENTGLIFENENIEELASILEDCIKNYNSDLFKNIDTLKNKLSTSSYTKEILEFIK